MEKSQNKPNENRNNKINANIYIKNNQITIIKLKMIHELFL